MFDPVSYLMGKKSGGGGGGSSIANALCFTLTPVDAATATADSTAGQIAEAFTTMPLVVALITDNLWVVVDVSTASGVTITIYDPVNGREWTLTASSADSNTFTLS